MKLLEIFIQTPLAGAVGWTVLHSLWQGAFVSALLGIVLLAVRSPRFRYTAACIAMLTMIGAFGVTLVHLLPASHESLWKSTFACAANRACRNRTGYAQQLESRTLPQLFRG